MCARSTSTCAGSASRSRTIPASRAACAPSAMLATNLWGDPMVHRLRPMHWRIASAYILLIVCTLALLSLVLLQLLRATYLQTLEDGLAGQARLVASIAGDRPTTIPSTTLAATVGDLRDQLGARVTLVAADGTVLADSLQ